MNNKFDLSIIIPCHNSGSVLGPLLTSLLKQKIYNYKVKILFVLDSNTDNTVLLVSNYFKQSKYHIQIDILPDSSAATARNYGITKAESDYIWFMDSDDWLIDDLAIFKLLSIIRYNNYDLLMFNYDYPIFFQFERTYAVIWQYIFKTEFLQDIKFPDQKHDEDLIFMNLVRQKIANQNNNKVSIPQIADKLYYYNFGRFESTMESRYRGTDFVLPRK